MQPFKSKLSTEVKTQIVELRNKGAYIAGIAHELEIAYTTTQNFLATEEAWAMLEVVEGNAPPKILYFDVEVAPSVVLAFQRWQVNVAKEGVLQEPYLLTYAGAFDDGEVFGSKLTDFPAWDTDITNDYDLVLEMWSHLDEADIVIAHNSKFDKGHFNQRCSFWGILPPSPYKLICTLKEVRKAFSLPSNSLDSVTKYFKLTNKLSAGGFGTWRKAIDGDPTALDDMLEYNLGDIPTLREVYKTVLPFMVAHPNMATYYTDNLTRCYKCGSLDLEETDQFTYTGTGKFELTKCGGCGSWNSKKVNVLTKDKKASLNRATI